MPSKNREFALYCCDLLAGVGPCVAKSMFGGWGISTGGLTIALMTDLGHGDKLWLKACDDTRPQFVAAGGEQFLYPMKSRDGTGGLELKGMNYFTAPDEAMESAALMLPWARLALQAAVAAAATKPSRKKPAAATKSASTSKRATPARPVAPKARLARAVKDLFILREKPRPLGRGCRARPAKLAINAAFAAALCIGE
jgi:DNA transformation protein